jgi:hypothetical protein
MCYIDGQKNKYSGLVYDYLLRGYIPAPGGYSTTKNILGSANRQLSLIRNGPCRKRLVEQFIYCWLSICRRGNDFTELLPSNDMGMHIHVHRLMGFMKPFAEMGPGAMTHLLSFLKIGSDISKLKRKGKETHTHC